MDAKESVLSGLKGEVRRLTATVEVLQQAAAADGQLFTETRDGLREDVVKLEKMLASQAEAMETSDEYGLFLEEELEESMEMVFHEEAEVRDIAATADVAMTMERYSPREDWRALPQRLRPRFLDIERAVGSLTEKVKSILEICVQDLRQVRERTETLESSSGGDDGGTAADRDPSETGPPSGLDVGHEDDAEHGALWGDASGSQPEGDGLGFHRLQVPPAG